MEINSGNVTFPHYRSDPVFPAKSYRALPESTAPSFLPEGYFNDNEYASVINCEESVEICDSHINKCWSLKMGWMPPGERLQNWDHSNFVNLNEHEFALTLLRSALADSCIVLSTGLEAASHCKFYDCTDLPHDQWILEVRRWFEASLARIQFNVLDIARGTGNQGEDYKDIDPMYRGICKMVKFKSNGWRNVNFWGLLSLLGLVCGTSVASLRTEHGDVWLMVGIRSVVLSFRTVCWLAKSSATAVPRSFKLVQRWQLIRRHC